jgi:hypothetical protein
VIFQTLRLRRLELSLRSEKSLRRFLTDAG